VRHQTRKPEHFPHNACKCQIPIVCSLNTTRAYSRGSHSTLAAHASELNPRNSQQPNQCEPSGLLPPPLPPKHIPSHAFQPLLRPALPTRSEQATIRRVHTRTWPGWHPCTPSHVAPAHAPPQHSPLYSLSYRDTSAHTAHTHHGTLMRSLSCRSWAHGSRPSSRIQANPTSAPSARVSHPHRWHVAAVLRLQAGTTRAGRSDATPPL